MDLDPMEMTQGLPIVSPANMLPVQVAHREVIAPGVVSLDLVLPGARQAPAPYLPGQFITLALPTPRETLYRSYSLCGSGDAHEPWQIAIKRMQMGAVSTYFYTSVQEGMLLYASLPRGTFTLPSRVYPEDRFVFVAAGSGITPIIGMLRALAMRRPDERPRVQLHYASRSDDEVIFGEELSLMDPDEIWLHQYHYFSANHDRMTARKVLDTAGRAATKSYWYMCGPESLKRDIQSTLEAMGIDPEMVHTEIFATQAGPAYRVGTQTGAAVARGSLRIVETGATLDVKPRETLLTALERHGYHPNFSCRAGACGACKLQVLDGEVEPVGETLSRSERDEGYVLSCIAQPIGDVTLASGGRPPAGGSAGQPDGCWWCGVAFLGRLARADGGAVRSGWLVAGSVVADEP